jgi:hypothetical protein
MNKSIKNEVEVEVEEEDLDFTFKTPCPLKSEICLSQSTTLTSKMESQTTSVPKKES